MTKKRFSLKTDTACSPTIRQGFEEFLMSRNAKGVREATLKGYQYYINQFSMFCDDTLTIDTVNAKNIYEFVMWLQKRNPAISATTVNGYLRHLRTVINYWGEQNYLTPFKITLQKAEKNLKEGYTDAELKILLQEPTGKLETFAQIRNWAIVNLLVATGLRRSTVLKLELDNFDFENKKIRIRPNQIKSRKPLILNLPLSLEKVLKKYLKIRRSFTIENNYFFVNEWGEQMSPDSLSESLNKYNKIRGVNTTGMHRYRHTFAKKLCEKNFNAYKIMEALGHSSLDMTKEYINLYGSEQLTDYNPLDELIEQKRKKIKRI